MEGEKKETKQQKKKYILLQMRLLLNDYPIKIEFNGFQTQEDLIHNILLIYDLMKFCRYKTNSDELAEKIDNELKEFERIDLQRLRNLYLIYNGSTMEFGRTQMKEKMLGLISENLNFFLDRVQYYVLAIPIKGKKFMHLRTTHGFPSAIAEEFESQEIEEGGKIDLNKPFKLDEEGKVIQVD